MRFPSLLHAGLIAAGAGNPSTAYAVEPEGWWVMRAVTIGAIRHHFIVIEGGAATKPENYPAIVEERCGNDGWCQVYFWDDPNYAAVSVPFTDAQADALAASYYRNPNSGAERLLYACRILNDHNQCFHADHRGSSTSISQDSEAIAQSDEAVFDTCGSNGVVEGLNPHGDGFLAVRTGPGTAFEQIDSVYNGQQLFICASEGDWFQVIYTDYPVDCGVSTPGVNLRAYTGPCSKGWVHGNWVRGWAG